MVNQLCAGVKKFSSKDGAHNCPNPDFNQSEGLPSTGGCGDGVSVGRVAEIRDWKNRTCDDNREAGEKG